MVDLTTTTINQRRSWRSRTVAEILSFQQLGAHGARFANPSRVHAIELVRATRPTDESSPDFVKKYVNFGASVRAAQILVLAAKARALMKGRYHVTYEDVRALVAPILRHRILLNFHAESERLTTDEILRRLLDWKSIPRV